MFTVHFRRVFVHRIISTRQRGGHTSKPNPFMQDRYCSMVDWQSFAGSAALEKSMHSSRFDFSSLQTQQGYKDEQVSTSGVTTKKKRVYRGDGADGPLAWKWHRRSRVLVAARLVPQREWLVG